MNERVVIPVKTGIQIFVILSEAKDLALGKLGLTGCL